jgi:hypothetical protein
MALVLEDNCKYITLTSAYHIVLRVLLQTNRLERRKEKSRCAVRYSALYSRDRQGTSYPGYAPSTHLGRGRNRYVKEERLILSDPDSVARE